MGSVTPEEEAGKEVETHEVHKEPETTLGKRTMSA